MSMKAKLSLALLVSCLAFSHEAAAQLAVGTIAWAWYGGSANTLVIYVQRITAHLKDPILFPVSGQPIMAARGDA